MNWAKIPTWGGGGGRNSYIFPFFWERPLVATEIALAMQPYNLLTYLYRCNHTIIQVGDLVADNMEVTKHFTATAAVARGIHVIKMY